MWGMPQGEKQTANTQSVRLRDLLLSFSRLAIITIFGNPFPNILSFVQTACVYSSISKRRRKGVSMWCRDTSRGTQMPVSIISLYLLSLDSEVKCERRLRFASLSSSISLSVSCCSIEYIPLHVPRNLISNIVHSLSLSFNSPKFVWDCNHCLLDTIVLMICRPSLYPYSHPSHSDVRNSSHSLFS